MSLFDLHLSAAELIFDAAPSGAAAGDVVTWRRADRADRSSGVVIRTTTRGWAYVDTSGAGGVRHVTRLPVLALRAAGSDGSAA